MQDAQSHPAFIFPIPFRRRADGPRAPNSAQSIPMHNYVSQMHSYTKRSPIPKPHFSSSLTRSESHRQLLVMGWGVPCGLRGRFERLFYLRSVLTELTLPFRHGFSLGTCSSAPIAPAVGSGPRLFPSPDVYIILHNRDSVNSFFERK